MKKLFFALPLIFLAQIIYSQTEATEIEKFYSIILEIEQNESGLRTAQLITQQVHEGRVKRPTVSNAKSTSDFVIIDFLSSDDQSKHQLKLDNDLLTDYEYVNEEDELAHVKIPEKKKSYHIRIPYNPEFSKMNIYLNQLSPDKLISSFELQNN